MNLAKFLLIIILTLIFVTNLMSQQTPSSVNGKVTDQNGALINEANVSLIDNNKREVKILTDTTGAFSFTDISEGIYKLLVEKKGFAIYEIKELLISKITLKPINITLSIKIDDTNVDVSEDPNKPNISNNDNIVLKEKELEKILPEDPDEIAKYLKLLAGDSGGPDGASIYVDGFLTSRVPPKSSIGEVRIDNNPFSAEYEKIGSGVINIFTKISSRQLFGSVNASFNDESFNARNPFSLVRAPTQFRYFGGRIGGDFLRKRAAYSLNVSHRNFGEQRNVNASVIDQNFNTVPLRENYPVPITRVSLSGNTDFQLAKDKTLRLSYEIYSDSRLNQGVGGLSLFSSGSKSSSTDSTFRVSQTSIIKEKLINEFRFQFLTSKSENEGLSTNPRIVTDTFISGNSLVGVRQQTNDSFEINNVLTFEINNFMVRAGGGIRIRRISDYTPGNFRGTYIYNGGVGPKLNNGQLILDINGNPLTELISGLERYRRTLLFSSQGLTLPQIRFLGGGISQFSINQGDPSIELNQIETNGFIYNSWRVRSNISFSAGARIDSQTNLGGNIDVSPRLAIAWSPFQKEKTTIIRGGAGWYYDRVPLSLRIQPEKLKQNKIQSFLISDPAIIDNLENPPSIKNLGLFDNSKLQMIFSPSLRAAYFFQAAISLEQELPFKWKFTTTFTENTGRGLLRSRNIANPSLASYGNIYQFESNGVFNSHTLTARVSKQFKKYSLFVNYRFGSSKADTDGPQTFPINQFDVSGEYGPATFDTRHNLYFGGYLTVPFKISVSPSMAIRSGTPFNITLGQDLNYDSVFTDRPAFGDGKVGANILTTRFGVFDLTPSDTSSIIPRNFGRGPASVSIDIEINKDFTVFKDKVSNRQITLNLSSQIINVINTSNLANPIGVLSSPFFGQSISDNSQGIYSGARTITFHARLSF
jgi:hypothetical protein